MAISILLADNNADNGRAIAEGLQEFGHTVITANSVAGAISVLEKECVDVAILDVAYADGDGYKALEAISKLERKPRAIMLSTVSGETFVKQAMEMGAEEYLVKPIGINALASKIEDICRRQPAEAKKEQFPKLDERISNIFLSVGIPAHIKGYQFLRDAIKLVVAEPATINSITKRLYPSIAARYATSSSKVERAIRHAIEVSWSRGKLENINKLFGFKVFGVNDKPTNGEFIALLADKLLLEMRK